MNVHRKESPEKYLTSLLETVKKVTDKDEGCPWLVERMNHKALAHYLIEEAYETVETIENKESEKTLDELGDVLLQVLLHSKIAENDGRFTLADVMKNLSEKIIRRHPHVFEEGSSKIDLDTIVAEWEEIKKKEKAQDKPKSWQSEVSHHYPASLQAKKIGKKARLINFDWDSPQEVLDQIKLEIKEVEESLLLDSKSCDFSHTKEEIGDVYFGLAQLCRHLDIDPEVTAFLGNIKFCKRMDKMHELAKVSSLRGKSKEELEHLWCEAKKQL
jgi:tetrapyrrole methylase family protein/MazG family protein